VFGGQYQGPPELSPRSHFDNIFAAMQTVFELLIGDDWNTTMYQFVEISGHYAVFYFVGVLIVGNYLYALPTLCPRRSPTLSATHVPGGGQPCIRLTHRAGVVFVYGRVLNLFIAILLANFSTVKDDPDDDDDLLGNGLELLSGVFGLGIKAAAEDDGPDPDPEVVDRWDRLTEALLTRDAMLMTPRGATGLTRPDTMFSGLLSAKGALLSAKGACVSEVETTPRVRKGHTARTTCTYVLRASQRRC
jgi:hypothetical protein